MLGKFLHTISGSYIEDIKQQNPKRELPKDFDEEEFRKTKKTDAILQVKWYLIRDEIIKKEKIEVTDKDLEEAINSAVKDGWALEGIHFAMREASKRPAMAFILFTKEVLEEQAN